MYQSFVRKHSIRIWKTDVSAQKIDRSMLASYGIVIVLFKIDDKDIKIFFFEETLLLANLSMDIAFGMSFFTLSNIEVKFNN